MDFSHDSLHVESDIARAWTLPAHLYTDAATFAAEKEKIFSRTWQVVATPANWKIRAILSQPNSLESHCCSCGEPMACCVAFSTSAAIARDQPPKVVARASFFVVDITGGPMLWMARLSVRPN